VSAQPNPWSNTRIHIMAPQRRNPKAGDRRVTKKHGDQVRVPVYHDGMRVVTGSRPWFEWVAANDPPPRPTLHGARHERQGATCRRCNR
jgi:hypothetical protein